MELADQLSFGILLGIFVLFSLLKKIKKYYRICGSVKICLKANYEENKKTKSNLNLRYLKLKDIKNLINIFL